MTILTNCMQHFKAIAVTALVLSILAVASPSTAADTYLTIDLPEQPLQEALAATGKTFGLTVVAPGDLVRGKVAPAISGQLTADQAVDMLLKDSGLKADHSSNGAIVVREINPTATQNSNNSSRTNQVDSQNSSAGLHLEPVIVTGERSERTLFNTASSANVISGEEIDKTPSFKEVDDILQFVPNVDLGGNSNEGPTIRGIKAGGPLNGVYAFFGGARPRATITVDGRAVSFDEFIFGSTSVWDVDRVEVFRGPQTTSQGVNAIAGAIHVVTADPSFETSGKAQLEFGDYRHARASAAVSGPLVEDELAIRLSADLQRRDSALDMQPTQDYGPDPNTFMNGVVRGKLLWKPTAAPSLKMKLTLNRTQNEAPQAEYVKQPYHDRDPISTNMPTRRVIANNGIYDVTYDFSDSISVSNQLSYSNVDSKRYVDTPTSGAATSEKDEVSNETTVHWQNQSAGLSGLVGVFYQYANSDEYFNYILAGKGPFDDTQTSLGLYTELTYDITDRLDLTVGARYESDRQDRTGNTVGGTSYNVNLDYAKTYDAFLPKMTLGYDVTDTFRVGALVSKGFNPGGVTVLWSDGTTNYFDEETVWNYELFSRVKLLDNTLSLNTNIFYADYTGYQLNYLAGDYFGNPVYGIANADEAVSYGLEVSADYLATDDLHLFGGLGLLKTEIQKFDDAGGIDAEGAAFMRSPNVTLSMGADYQLFKGMTLGGRVRHVSSYKSEDTNDSLSAGDYTVCDLQASYEYDAFTVYGYVNNVFGEFYTVSELTSNRAILGNPRDSGVGIKYSF